MSSVNCYICNDNHYYRIATFMCDICDKPTCYKCGKIKFHIYTYNNEIQPFENSMVKTIYYKHPVRLQICCNCVNEEFTKLN